MSNNENASGSPASWLVSSSLKMTGDQTARFLAEGIWENPSATKDLELVRTMRNGDRIALKSMYDAKVTPFDNRGNKCRAIAIYATGTILENYNDGRRVRVAWNPTGPPREWYFFTSPLTVWQVKGGKPDADALLSFTFDEIPQDLDSFRNQPFWRSRFGDLEAKTENFDWTRFYEAMAERLLEYREDRPTLIAGLHEIASRVQGMSHLQDRFSDGSTGPLKDIDPFTALGVFNRSLTDANRKLIASEFAIFLGVDKPVPSSFDGIPVLNNQNSWFFGFATKRKHDDIDVLWDVFAAANRYVSSDEAEAEPSFLAAYDAAIARYGVAWNLSSGLYLAHPWDFVSLDSCARHYIGNELKIPIAIQKTIDGATYLKLRETLEKHFDETIYPVHSYPELALAAWRYRSSPSMPTEAADNGQNDESAMRSINADVTELSTNRVRFEPYSVDSIIDDGCFLDQTQLEKMLIRLRAKKNVILQGAPGTGKTWLARRLAFALIAQKDENRIRAVQFHPNLSYEDFVRGWRPNGDGKLALEDGIFMDSIRSALAEPSLPFVVVIEEINRGNPAQIFGELLTLLEADKRTPNEALELCYRRSDEERVHIPSNLYVIGTMNLADRSLALVDLALRRRFAFFDLEPRMSETWQTWIVNRCGVQPALATEIARRMLALNEDIASDLSLGRQFRIGHSFVTPPVGEIGVTAEWFKDVFETEIGPLLEEYWFDSAAKATAARLKLIAGL